VRGTRAQQKGNYESAIDHFKKALTIDPEYSDALNNLGVSFLHTNRADLAVQQFNRIIAIDPHAAMPYSNLAVAFLVQNKFTDAERTARRAVELDRAGTRGQLILGFTLVVQKKFTPEAEQNLRKASANFPQASLLLAPVLAMKGELQPAKDQLKRYLASGDQSARDVADDWMQQINSATHPKQ
jgi:Flp pilus assembly protein TadD